MNIFQTFEEFLASQGAQISVWGFVTNLLLSAVLAFILSRVYIECGRALSNRQAFARNFLMLTMTTMLIITVVKSSLALSLGLVGALSIVRFRAAIKEPEELAYLFLAIAIGLGLGANQRILTLVAFGVIIGIIWLTKFSHKSRANENFHLIVSSHNPSKVELEKIVQVLEKNCTAVSLKRFDDTNELLEAAFMVEFEDFPQMATTRLELQKLGDTIKITFLDNKGLGGIS